MLQFLRKKSLTTINLGENSVKRPIIVSFFDFIAKYSMKKNVSKEPKEALRAEKSFKRAVAAEIEDHRRRGQPVAVWKNGRAVWATAGPATPSKRRAT